MPTGGRLTLRAGWSDDGRISAGPAPRPPAPGACAIEIEDTGVGIPPGDADRVFNPFFTTKDGGTGLGLALTHKIIEDHGGSIDFRGAAGGGTVFRHRAAALSRSPGRGRAAWRRPSVIVFPAGGAPDEPTST